MNCLRVLLIVENSCYSDEGFRFYTGFLFRMLLAVKDIAFSKEEPGSFCSCSLAHLLGEE